MMIAAVEQGNLRGPARELPGGIQPAEPAAHDDDVWQICLRL